MVGLIINIVLNIILDQLRQNVDIIVQFLDIAVILIAFMYIYHDISYAFFQCVAIAQQTVEPKPALIIRCHLFELCTAGAQAFDQGIRILKRLILPDRIDRYISDNNLV